MKKKSQLPRAALTRKDSRKGTAGQKVGGDSKEKSNAENRTKAFLEFNPLVQIRGTVWERLAIDTHHTEFEARLLVTMYPAACHPTKAMTPALPPMQSLEVFID